MSYKTVKITAGARGYGGPLYITPTDEKNVILSFTGGEIHPCAKKLADLCGGKVVDAAKDPVPNDAVACAIVNCGGTIRMGYYPKLGIPTANINPGKPSGPMANFCVPELYVSGVSEESFLLVSESEAPDALSKAEVKEEVKVATVNDTGEETSKKSGKFSDTVLSIISKIGGLTGSFVNTIYSAARDAVDTALRSLIPFIIFISIISGIILNTGIGNIFANSLGGLLDSIPGMIIFGIILGIPVLSPFLAPGAVIESVLGVLVGGLIATGTLPVSMAVPAYMAIGICTGCDFIPVAMAIGDADADTIRYSVPAILFTRFLTAPIAVLVGVLFSIGM